jgi:hypothetical protein
VSVRAARGVTLIVGTAAVPRDGSAEGPRQAKGSQDGSDGDEWDNGSSAVGLWYLVQ